MEPGRHTRTQSLTPVHGQFRDADQPTVHAIGCWEETLKAWGEHASHTHEAGLEPWSKS